MISRTAEDFDEGLGWNVYFTFAHAHHFGFSLLLLFEQLHFTRDVAAVEVAGHVFAESRDAVAGDDFGAECGLDFNDELLAFERFFECGHDLPAATVRFGAMKQRRK